MNTADMSITELVDQSGVPSPRTIHFYVREGLLPRPAKPGGGARYGTEHLLRLLLIRELQKHHYKLSPIKERLDATLTGMSPEDMAALLCRLRSAPATPQVHRGVDDLQQYIEKKFFCLGAISAIQASADIGEHDTQLQVRCPQIFPLLPCRGEMTPV